MASDDGTDFKFYQYDPSFPAAVVFIAFFGIAALLHLWLLIRNRTWSFIPFFVGVVFEAIGYVGRAISAKETPNWTKNPYIIQSVLILLGPTLYAASIYMVLGRLIRLLDAGHYSMIRPTWLTKVFVLGDVLSFLAQGAGGGMLASAKSPDDLKRGENIILGGLGIQIIFFGFFMLVTVVFHVRIAKGPTPRSYSVTVDWRKFIYVLYFTSIMILIRSLFRMAEFGLGSDGPLQKSELYVLIFDGALMALVAAAFIWMHPGQIISGYKNLEKQVDAESQAGSYLMEDNRRPHHIPQETGYDGAPGMQNNYAYGYQR